MMNRRIVLLPALALTATSLSGCVAVAIPALAGTAMVGSRVDGNGARDTPAPVAASVPKQAAPKSAPAPKLAPVPTPTVTVMSAKAAPSAPPPAPISTSAKVPAPAPVITTAPAPVPVPVPVAAPPPPPVAVAAAAPAAVPPRIEPAPQLMARPERPERLGFAQFVRYGRGIAMAGTQTDAPLSAILSDPVALDGQRRRCEAGEQPVALIDLDPKDGVIALPTNPAKNPDLALGLAGLREAGVVIAWFTDLPVDESGALRSALEEAGLDPRGEDIISLRSDADNRKQLRKENLAANACIIAIAGDERPDFDDRFKYLRNPEAETGLERVIGDGWFLVEPVFANQGRQGQ